MHILIVHQAFVALDEAGGTRHYELARHLAAHGHRVTVIASPISYLTGKARRQVEDDQAAPSARRVRWKEEENPEPGITILRTYTYSALHRSFVHRVFSFFSFMFSSFWVGLGVRQVDLVWGTSPPIFQGVSAWLLARLKRVRFLFEVRDLWPAFAIDVGVLRNKLLIRLSLWLERFLYRRADHLMVNSPGYVEHVRARGARQVTLIPNGADTAMFDPQADGAALRVENGLQEHFIVLYAGAHGMSNDLGVVLQAAAQTKEERIAYVLVGDGKEKAALQAQAEQLGLKNLLFLPPVPKSGMNGVLAAADACIAILKPIEMYKTTYPNKVFDYLAAGRPILLAIDGVIRQVVDAAGAGIFVPPGDSAALARAAEQLAADPAKARRMGLAGRHYLETHFDRAELAERLRILIESLKKK